MRLMIVAVAFPLAATAALAQFQVPGECPNLRREKAFPPLHSPSIRPQKPAPEWPC